MKKALERTTYYVIGASITLTVLAFVFGGLDIGLGAAAGGLVAVVNWLAMRWIGGRLTVANQRGKATWGSLLAMKMAAVLVVVWLILKSGAIAPLGFIIGMSGFVLGVILGGLHHGAEADPVKNLDPMKNPIDAEGSDV